MAAPLMEGLAFAALVLYSLALVWSAWAHDMVGVMVLFAAMVLFWWRRDLSILGGVLCVLFWFGWSVVKLVGGA